MICTNCGKEIQDGASFCPYCGALFADGLVRIHYEAQLESSAETLPVYNAETVRAAWDRQKATQMALPRHSLATAHRRLMQAISTQMTQPQHLLQALHRRPMQAIST